MKPIVIAVNPSASGGEALNFVDGVQELLTAHGYEPRVYITSSAADATKFAANADPEIPIVVLGGDGFMGRIAEGAVQSGVTMLPLAAGRGNDFIRSLGLSLDPLQALKDTLDSGTIQNLDVGQVNGRVFLGVLISGFGAEANQIANKTRFVRGQAVYAYSALLTWMRSGRHKFRIWLDGVEHTASLWMLDIGNSGGHGGGMRSSPEASMTDGLLDVVLFQEIKRFEFVSVMKQCFSGKHVEHPGVHVHRAKKILVDADPTLPVYADGDPIASFPLEVETLPGALRVWA